MAGAALASQQHLLSCSRPKAWPLTKSVKCRCFSVVSCSSSLSSNSPPSETKPESAETCVNFSLSLFFKGRVKDALAQFDIALTLDPTPVEAQAALYSMLSCIQSLRGEVTRAAESLRTALKEYNLKFGTILNDPDLASFRASPEFELQQEDHSRYMTAGNDEESFYSHLRGRGNTDSLWVQLSSPTTSGVTAQFINGSTLVFDSPLQCMSRWMDV